jgi:NitT/TauT family transport system substrate-binding protein
MMWRVVILTSMALVLLACDQRAKRETGSVTVRITIHRDPIAFLPLRVSQTHGYYQQQQVDVRMSDVSGGSKAIEALLGGSADVAVGSVSDVILLAAQGRRLRCFYVLYTRPLVALVVAPELNGKIRSIADLKGHTVGVSAPGSASHQFLNFQLESAALSPNDVSIVSVGMSNSSIAALEHRHVDAAVLIASAITNFEDRHTDTRFLADTRSPNGAQHAFGSAEFPSLALVAEDAWLQTHADAVRRLVRSVREGMHWMHDSSVEKVREEIPESARMNNADSDYQAIRDAQQVISPDGLMPADAPQRIVHLLASSDSRVKQVDVSQLYTNEFASMK